MSATRRPGFLEQAFGRVYGWATLRLYHELAWAYDPISALVSAGRWAAWRSFALDYVTGPRVLEIGFGTGELLVELHRRGFAVIGADASPEMHRVAGAKLRRKGIAAPRLLARADALPLASGSVDTVVSTFPAGFILETRSLAELGRVLRPSGALVIVGLAVELPQSARYPLSIVPGSWGPLWDHFARTAGDAGLTAQVTWRGRR